MSPSARQAASAWATSRPAGPGERNRGSGDVTPRRGAGPRAGRGSARPGRAARIAVTILAAAGLATVSIPSAAAPARAAAALAAPSIWGMGLNYAGELGNGNTSLERTPVQAAATPAAPVQIS